MNNRHQNHRRRRCFGGLLLAGAAVAALGCRQEVPVTFEENLVRAHQIHLKEGLQMDQTLADINWALHRMFGTPDDPKLPEVMTEDEDLSTLLSMENLQQAAGPADAAGRGLYRRHCATCHGVTGNGRGTTAALLDPYPRDYRMGVFKFKSTARGAKPTKQDIARVIRDGIPGTQMAKIPELTEQDIEALTDYVIYLSIRGELERTMLDEAVFELDLAGGDRIISPELAYRLEQDESQFPEEQETVEAQEPGENGEPDEEQNGDDDEQEEEKESEREKFLREKELFEEQWEYIEEYAAEVAEAWLQAEDNIVEVQLPAEIPVPENRQEFEAMMAGPEADALRASVKRGQTLFVGKTAACNKCHGDTGQGDGQTTDYDDWAKDWTVRAGLDPKDAGTLVPLIARGALPPRNIKPRNFAEGVFRGGSHPKDLYLRIVQGIEGTPMPGVTFVEGDLEQQDVWHLINYIRSLDKSDPADDQPATVPPAGQVTQTP